MTCKMAVNLKSGDRILSDSMGPLVVKTVNWVSDRLMFVEYEGGPIGWDHIPPQRVLMVDPR